MTESKESKGSKKPEEPSDPKESPPTPGRRTVARRPKEIGGPSGPEPTRYGDWERKGLVSDF